MEERLLDAVRAASAGESRLIVLVGDALYTVRALREALEQIGGAWRRVWVPAGPRDLVAGLRTPAGLGGAEPWTVVRLQDLARFLLPADPELAATAAAALRSALRDERLTPLLVLATFEPRPDDWHRLTRTPASGGDTGSVQAQALLRTATVLTVTPPAAGARPGPVLVAVRADRPVGTTTASGPAADAGPTAGPTSHLAPLPPLRAAPPALPVAPPVPASAVPVAAAPSMVEPAAEAGRAAADAAPTSRPGPEQVLEPPISPGPEREPEGRPEPTPGAEPEPELEPPVDAEPDVVRPWEPSAARLPLSVPEPADAARWRAVLRENAGNLTGAERLYEQAAMGGDLDALASLGRLRDEGGRQAVETLLEQAVAEGNTAVLFTLAAAGDPRALAELARLRDEAAEPPAPPS